MCHAENATKILFDPIRLSLWLYDTDMLNCYSINIKGYNASKPVRDNTDVFIFSESLQSHSGHYKTTYTYSYPYNINTQLTLFNKLKGKTNTRKWITDFGKEHYTVTFQKPTKFHFQLYPSHFRYEQQLTWAELLSLQMLSMSVPLLSIRKNVAWGQWRCWVVRPFSLLHRGRQKDSCVYNHPFTELGVRHVAWRVFVTNEHICVHICVSICLWYCDCACVCVSWS